MNIQVHTSVLLKDMEAAQTVEQWVTDLLTYAEGHGLILTIERRSILPLAQGNHESHVSIYPEKEFGMKLENAA